MSNSPAAAPPLHRRRMTHCNLIQPTEVDGIAPLPGVRDLLHLDGHCFLGDAGLLAVALTEPSLARLRRSASPTHWLLPLERPAVAVAATALPGEVFWLGSRPPEHLLGALAADAVAQAVLNAVRHAVGLPGLPAERDLGGPL
ncbi:MAG: hypothetical protein ACK45B_10855 [Limisphaerales bacterium]